MMKFLLVYCKFVLGKDNKRKECRRASLDRGVIKVSYDSVPLVSMLVGYLYP